MRVTGGQSLIFDAITAQQFADRFINSFLNAATAAELEERANAELARIAVLNTQPDTRWVVGFTDLYGAGDGRVFGQRVIAANALPPGSPITLLAPSPESLRFVFWEGGDARALDANGALAIAGIDDLLGITGVDSATIVQQFAAGASGGRPCMAGLVLLLLPSAPPSITSATLAGDLTIGGSGFVTTLPNSVTKVLITGPGVGAGIVLTEAEITAAGGSVAAGTIVVPAALLGTTAVGDTVVVYANGSDSAGEVIV